MEPFDMILTTASPSVNTIVANPVARTHFGLIVVAIGIAFITIWIHYHE